MRIECVENILINAFDLFLWKTEIKGKTTKGIKKIKSREK